MSVKMLQINVGRGREAQNLLISNGMQKGIFIILVSEPYKNNKCMTGPLRGRPPKHTSRGECSKRNNHELR